MEIPKASEIQQKEDEKIHGAARANDADVHAMKALLNKKEGGDELSSLFSSQTRQVKEKLEKRPLDDDLENRLKKYADSQRDKGEDKQDGDTQKETDELVQDVAEHILISDREYTDPGQVNEVRIKIKDRILKDAHVHIIKEKECLSIKLVSSDMQSVQTLVAASARLEKQIEQHYKGVIRIRVIHINEEGKGALVKDGSRS